MTVLFNVNNVQKDITSFAIPEMSLSSARSEMERADFEIQIEVNEVLTALQEDYTQWVIESKEDDEICGSPQDDLAIAGYPGLDRVLLESELLDLVVGGYLFGNLIAKFSSPSGQSVFWWDSTTRCWSDNNKIFIKGICYTKRS